MKLIEYIRDTKAELKHVSWPTRKQAIAYTFLVVIISFAVSIYLGFFDALFAQGIKFIVGSK